MDDVSFFFTNFPDHFFERDLWKVFQRWGRVLDVFISRKLNARKQRFSFVRFQGVNDAFSLERELDAIWIGTWKLQVNIPRYRRNELARNVWHDNQRPERPRNVWKPKVQQKQEASYAQVVSGVSVSGLKEEDSSSWLEGSFVGCIRDHSCIQTIKESFVLGGFSVVKLRFLGERFVLLSCDAADVLGKLILDNKAWFNGLFLSVVPWDGAFAVTDRFIWVHCRGIPLQFWCSQCFINIGALVGKVIQIDEC